MKIISNVQTQKYLKYLIKAPEAVHFKEDLKSYFREDIIHDTCSKIYNKHVLIDSIMSLNND